MNDGAYHSLREHIEALLTESRQHVRQSADWQKVETYWHIGDALAAHLDSYPGSTYGKQVVRGLTTDLKLGYTVLYEILRFRRVVADPEPYARTHLGWSHFRALIHLPTADQLDHYARLTADNHWSTRQLKRAIEAGGDADHVSLPLAPSSPLRPAFGEPLTYRVVADRLLEHAPPAIDFGFHQVWVPDDALAGFAAAAPGDRVRLQVTGMRARILAGRPRLWTYAARVLRVVDGDTLAVVVDLGFGRRADSRLRLRGIDTAELYKDAGRHARDFVEHALADAPTVLISTRRTDAYGRYLADVKYLPGVSDPAAILERGTYLNGQLLKEGLATQYLG